MSCGSNGTCEAAGGAGTFYNLNAADAAARETVLEAIAGGPKVEVLLHSLAFGSLAPLLQPEEGKALTERQMSMTLEVMAHSLVWWSRDLVSKGLMGRGGRIFAMTSSGSHTALPDYGAVGAAKSALETHTRYLAMELAPLGITANAILAGVTDTAALRKIPRWEEMVETATRRNPSGRLTRPEDVANFICLMATDEAAWVNGALIRVDGGEHIGS